MHSPLAQSRRRVKPTLVTHIGLPPTAASFRPMAASHDPLLTRSLRTAVDEPAAHGQPRREAATPAACPSAFPVLRVLPENERRLNSLAQWLARMRKGVRGFLELCELLFAHLKTLHQIYSVDEAGPSPGSHFLALQACAVEAPVESVEDVFADTFLPVYLGIELLKVLLGRIVRLMPSLVGYLEANSCAKRLCPKVFHKAADKTRSSLGARTSLPRASLPAAPEADAGAAGGLRDAFDTIAYADKRDSRNFSEQPFLHANQQKVRDLFLEYIRSAGADFVPQQQAKDLVYKVREIMGKLLAENYAWFADLLIFQFDQIRKRMPAALSTSRLERLEERLTKSSEAAKPDVYSSGIVQFIRMADSHRLHCRLVASLRHRILELERPLIDGRRAGFGDAVKRLCHLARLLAALDSFEDECDEGLVGRLEDALAASFAVVRLPWVLAYAHTCSSARVKLDLRHHLLRYMGHLEAQADLGRRDFTLALLIHDHVGAWGAPDAEPWAPARPDTGLAGLSLTEPCDLDPSVDQEQLVTETAVYTTLLGIVRSYRRGEPTPSPAKPAPPAAEGSPPELKFTRKIRPVTVGSPQQAPDARPDGEALQKQLRHWYWWQWPDMKELVDSLVKYAVAEVSRSPRPLTSDERLAALRDVIGQSLPPLLPLLLKGERRAVDLAVALTLERAAESLGD